MQSLAVMDTQTGKVTDFPDDRTALRAKQTLYSGLAFSGDGKHLYASMGSETDPVGDGNGEYRETGWWCMGSMRWEDYAGADDEDSAAAAGGGAEDDAAGWVGGR